MDSMLSVADLRVDPDPVLRSVAEPVNVGDELFELGQQMLAVMHAANGVGLAAPQVGMSRRLFVMSTPLRTLTVCNPSILDHSEPYRPVEGCLSIPGKLFTPLRHRSIRARWQQPDGQWIEQVLTGLEAEIFEHEVDHLDGVLLDNRE